MVNNKYYLFEIESFSNNDGTLVAIEDNKQIPFSIKRVFYEYGVNKNSVKGRHANKNSRFCLIAVSGSCEVIIEDGNLKGTFKLDKPTKALYIDKLIWKTMTHFSDDCVLLVLSDCIYDKNEYITDFDEYLKVIRN